MSELTRPRLPNPTLCLLTDLSVVGGSVSRLSDVVSVAVDNGVNMVQIRAPDVSAEKFDHLVSAIVRSVDERVLTIVNPSRRHLIRYDGVNGVQLSENATATVDRVRELYGDAVIAGRSVHDIDGARKAMAENADYVVLGTIFPSASHPGGDWHGVEIIRLGVTETALPIIGIGGITVDNARRVMDAGAHGIAVVRSILGATDPGYAARKMREALGEVVDA